MRLPFVVRSATERSACGSDTIFKRGEIWYVSRWADVRQIQDSSRSRRRRDAVRLRDQLLGKKARGEMGDAAAAQATCGGLPDDLLEFGKSNVKPSTARTWEGVINANIRHFFGYLKAASLTTGRLKTYRRKRLAVGRSESTCNRELSILRTALRRGRRCTPPQLPQFRTSPWSRSRMLAGDS